MIGSPLGGFLVPNGPKTPADVELKIVQLLLCVNKERTVVLSLVVSSDPRSINLRSGTSSGRGSDGFVVKLKNIQFSRPFPVSVPDVHVSFSI